MKFLKKLKWLWYILFFFSFFIVMIYLTFPADNLKYVVARQIENALGAEGEGKWVRPPLVKIDSLSLWRVSGISMKNVVISPGSFTEEPVESWHFDKLKLRIGILNTIRGRLQVSFDSNLYAGRARGGVTLTEEGGLSYIWFDISKIDLKKLAGDNLGVPLFGQLNVKTDFDLGKNPSTDGEGVLNLDLKNLSIGPGQLPLPVPGMVEGLTVPKIKFGHLSGKISLQKGKGKTTDFNLAGGDIEANLNLDVDLHKNLMRSKLDGAGWFRLEPKFLEANPSYQAILELSSDLKQAREPDGKYYFSLKGTLGMPFPKFGKSKRSENKNPLKPKKK